MWTVFSWGFVVGILMALKSHTDSTIERLEELEREQEG